jgi:hypothetical protein
MSDPGKAEQPELPETSSIQQDGAIPETVVPQEEKPETPPETEAEPEKSAEASAESEKPKRKPWYQDRIDQLTRQKNEERAARERAEAEIAALKPKEEGEQAAPFDPKQFEQVIEQRAQALITQREAQRRTQGFIEAGNKEFGASDFMEKCNEVAALGAGDSPEFMQIITDPELVPDGHKLIAALAENPEETQHILSLPPMRMAAALARFAATAKVPEKPISKAPPPIKPIGGSAKASAPNDNEPIQEWMAKRRAELAAKGKH